MARILVLYYSMYGHIETMAKAVADGARCVKGAEVDGRQPSENELKIARFQGKHVTEVAMKQAA